MEFKTTLHQVLGYDESAPEVLALFVHFDADRSGRISYTEMENVLKHNRATAASTSAAPASAMAVSAPPLRRGSHAEASPSALPATPFSTLPADSTPGLLAARALSVAVTAAQTTISKPSTTRAPSAPHCQRGSNFVATTRPANSEKITTHTLTAPLSPPSRPAAPALSTALSSPLAHSPSQPTVPWLPTESPRSTTPVPALGITPPPAIEPYPAIAPPPAATSHERLREGASGSFVALKLSRRGSVAAEPLHPLRRKELSELLRSFLQQHEDGVCKVKSFQELIRLQYPTAGKVEAAKMSRCARDMERSAQMEREKAQKRRQDAELLFRAVDTDGKGTVDRQEFLQLRESIGLPEEFLRNIFREKDRDGNGELDLEEFTELVLDCNLDMHTKSVVSYGEKLKAIREKEAMQREDIWRFALLSSYRKGEKLGRKRRAACVLGERPSLATISTAMSNHMEVGTEVHPLSGLLQHPKTSGLRAGDGDGDSDASPR